MIPPRFEKVLDSDGSGDLSTLEFQAAMKKLVLRARARTHTRTHASSTHQYNGREYCAP
jgi:hypothetical protein